MLDFTRILSGPVATMLLADLGAEIIKVERPGAGDDTRLWGPPFWRGTSTYFAAINRGKQSLAVDLADEQGRALVRELVAEVDVVVENFRPGVMERLGLDYGSVVRLNPGIVYATINGFGSHGPKAAEAGTEVIVEAETGLMAMMGSPDGPPVRFGVAIVDIATGMTLCAGVLAALLERSRTGSGRYLEFPLYSTAFSVLATVIASASVDPACQQGRWGSGHPSIVPYAAFAGSDGYVVLGAINEDMWQRLCETLGLEDLRDDERCATNEARVGNRRFVEGVLGVAVGRLAVAEVTERLSRAGVLVAPVRSVDEAVADPQVAVLSLIDEVDGVRFARTPLSQFNLDGLTSAPGLGEHSRSVLERHLDLGEARIADLAAAGVLQIAADGPANPDLARLGAGRAAGT